MSSKKIWEIDGQKGEKSTKQNNDIQNGSDVPLVKLKEQPTPLPALWNISCLGQSEHFSNMLSRASLNHVPSWLKVCRLSFELDYTADVLISSSFLQAQAWSNSSCSIRLDCKPADCRSRHTANIDLSASTQHQRKQTKDSKTSKCGIILSVKRPPSQSIFGLLPTIELFHSLNVGTFKSLF